jgi:hypothetical protein
MIPSLSSLYTPLEESGSISLDLRLIYSGSVGIVEEVYRGFRCLGELTGLRGEGGGGRFGFRYRPILRLLRKST